MSNGEARLMTKGEFAFFSQPMSDSEIKANNEMRQMFADLTDFMTSHTENPDPRYKELAITHLEIAGMFATKMLSHNADVDR
jgi:hypothetical protein